MRTLSLKDVNDDRVFALRSPLGRSAFKLPVLEKYEEGETYYGIYDQTRQTTGRVSSHFCARAVALFEDVARSLPHATEGDGDAEVYRHENRKLVASHLRRERSKLLSFDCKEGDEYQCRVCAFRFEDGYGTLGNGFAEAHHIFPLGKLRDNVRTQIEDLATVCSNCHRMLHRMEGQRDDIKKLKAIVRRHRQ